MSARAPFDLYWVLDPRPDGAIDRALRVIDGCPPQRVAIQIRAKNAGLEVHRHALAALEGPAEHRGVALFVNEHVELAGPRLGVHLSERSPSIDEVRARLGQRPAIGASCHDAAGIERRRGADFMVLGPVLRVPGKNVPLGWERFAALARDAPMPVFALGGIASAEDVRCARDAGARGIALSRALEGDRAPEVLASLLAALA
jgi:thiamine-phosphate diphosphorylase